MNILIITTYFPPDTAISAVRPYMFAKHLLQRGHTDTVMRSGLLNSSADHYFGERPKGLRVISYLGENSPAEAFERGEIAPPSVNSQSRIHFLPEVLRKPLAQMYHSTDYIRDIHKARMAFSVQKCVLDSIKNEHFDIIFATYGRLENIYAGEYAAKLFHCKWILDLRDSIPQKVFDSFFENIVSKRIQDCAIRKADACTVVSDGLRESSREARRKEIITLYNGYEPTQMAAEEAIFPEQGVFSICYTGQIYGRREQGIILLLKVLKKLSEDGRIDSDNIKFQYAGPEKEFNILLKHASDLQLERILVNHGYVSRAKAEEIQIKSDIFLVLAENNHDYKGDLSGKFYEGIRCERPILAIVVGNAPRSELFELNEKYHYGFCYEDCQRQELFPKLCDYLAEAYQEKIKLGQIQYHPASDFALRFRYDNLTKELEEICKNLIAEQ